MIQLSLNLRLLIIKGSIEGYSKIRGLLSKSKLQDQRMERQLLRQVPSRIHQLHLSEQIDLRLIQLFMIKSRKIKLSVGLKMSCRQIIMKKRKEIVMTSLLEELKSSNKEIEIGSKLDALDSLGIALINNYRDHFLINMAELGTSPDTDYPGELFELPKLTIAIGAEKKEFKLSMNVFLIVMTIRDKIESDARLALSSTIRNCLSTLGLETAKQLRVRKIDGLLARKYPKICRQAMHMGFDFNQDIPSSELSRTELKVKQYLYQQLKRRESRRSELEDDVNPIDFE
nr:coat protein [Carrot chordovirus 4]